QYKTVNNPVVCGAGIENGAETQGIQYYYLGHANPSTQGIVANRAVKYTPDAATRTSVAGAGTGGPVLLLAASPNPCRGLTSIAFRLPARQAASLEIYGVDGRRVVLLWKGVADAGITSARWDGLDAGGHRVPAGLYFARFQTDGVAQSGKVMVLR